MGEGHTVNDAERIVRSVFHVLSDTVSLEGSLQFISQFPMFLKSLYVDGRNNHKPVDRIRYMDPFILAVVVKDGSPARNDFSAKRNQLQTIEIVFKVLKRHFSKGEMDGIKSGLPRDLKVLFDTE